MNTVSQTSVKRRWTEEEVTLLVRAEAKLRLEGVDKLLINARLRQNPMFSSRTMEAIKSKRKGPDYTASVDAEMTRLSESAQGHASGQSQRVATNRVGLGEPSANPENLISTDFLAALHSVHQPSPGGSGEEVLATDTNIGDTLPMTRSRDDPANLSIGQQPLNVGHELGEQGSLALSPERRSVRANNLSIGQQTHDVGYELGEQGSLAQSPERRLEREASSPDQSVLRSVGRHAALPTPQGGVLLSTNESIGNVDPLAQPIGQTFLTDQHTHSERNEFNSPDQSVLRSVMGHSVMSTPLGGILTSNDESTGNVDPGLQPWPMLGQSLLAEQPEIQGASISQDVPVSSIGTNSGFLRDQPPPSGSGITVNPRFSPVPTQFPPLTGDSERSSRVVSADDLDENTERLNARYHLLIAGRREVPSLVNDHYGTCKVAIQEILEDLERCACPPSLEDQERLNNASDRLCDLLVSTMCSAPAARGAQQGGNSRHNAGRTRRGRPAGRGPVFGAAADRVLSTRTNRRRQQYKLVQAAFDRSSGAAAEMVLSGKWRETQTELPSSVVTPYWTELFSRPSPPDRRLVLPVRDSQWCLYEPFTVTETAMAKKSTTPSADGPDGLSFVALRSAPDSLLTCVFNLWMVLENFPSSMCIGRTVLIPKVPQPADAREFRPITVASHLARLFNKMLSTRISIACPVDPIQRAFLPVDGCQQNLAILDAVISRGRSLDSEVHLVFLDMLKAFDSVGHPTINRALIRAGVVPPIRRLIMSGYCNSTTTFKVGGEVSEPVCIRRGVKQGCPLSPCLFNLVIDELSSVIPGLGVGVRLSPEAKVSMLAFADDLVLVGETRIGLGESVRECLDLLSGGGLEVNPNKCKSLSIVVDKKRKIWAVDDAPYLDLGGSRCEALGPVDTYKYLGIHMGATGRACTSGSLLQGGLEEITAAPLKPQQRMTLLVKHLIPKLQHVLVLGKVFKTQLARMDRAIRVSVRSWLKLPGDAMDSFIHAPFDSGGMGVTRLGPLIALAKQRRLDKLVTSTDPVLSACVQLPSLASDRRYWSQGVYLHGSRVSDTESIGRIETAKLVSMVDGKGLIPARESPSGNRWVGYNNNWISGSDYIKVVNVRCNALATPARTARGYPPLPPRNRCWRCGPDHVATLGHISQSCPISSSLIVARHDNIVTYVGRCLTDAGWTVSVEPRLQDQNSRLLQPDLVCIKGEELVVLDVQVCADKFGMSRAREAKELKYGTPDLARCIENRWQKRPSSVTGLIINWRGLWHGVSRRKLLSMGLRHSHLAVCSVKACTWTHSVFRNWKRTGGLARTSPP